MKPELELKKVAFGRRLGPLFTFMRYLGERSDEEPAIVLLQKAQFQGHGDPAGIRVTIEWEDVANEQA